jgi:hypothetical protein
MSFKSCRCARTKTQNVVRYRGIRQISGGEDTSAEWKSTPLCPLYLRFYEDHPSAAVECETCVRKNEGSVSGSAKEANGGFRMLYNTEGVSAGID